MQIYEVIEDQVMVWWLVQIRIHRHGFEFQPRKSEHRQCMCSTSHFGVSINGRKTVVTGNLHDGLAQSVSRLLPTTGWRASGMEMSSEASSSYSIYPNFTFHKWLKY